MGVYRNCIFLWLSNNIQRHYSEIFTLWNFHHPPWHLKLFKTFTTSSPPPFLLDFMKALCPSHNKNHWFDIWVKPSWALYLYLGNSCRSLIHVLECGKKNKYIISAPEPKHLVLIHSHTHTHSQMLFLDISLSTKTDDAHFFILHSSIHISVNLCRASD